MPRNTTSISNLLDLYSRGAVPFKALIDTGATRTMIAKRVIARLGLQQVNKIEFSGLGGTTWRPGYLFHVALINHLPPTHRTSAKFKSLIEP
jgi:hypothetical protein